MEERSRKRPPGQSAVRLRGARGAGQGRRASTLSIAAAVEVDDLEAPAVDRHVFARRRQVAEFLDDHPGERRVVAALMSLMSRIRAARVDGQAAVEQPGAVLALHGAGASASPASGRSPAMPVRMSVGVTSPSRLPYSSITIAMWMPEDRKSSIIRSAGMLSLT